MSVVPYGHETNKSRRRDAVIYPELSPASLDESVQLNTSVKNNYTAPLCNDVFLQYLKDELKNNEHLLTPLNIKRIFPDDSSKNYIDRQLEHYVDMYKQYKFSHIPSDMNYEVKNAIGNHIRKKYDNNGKKIKTVYAGDISDIPFSKFIDDIPSIEETRTIIMIPFFEQCNFVVIINIYKRLAKAIKCFDFKNVNHMDIDPLKINECIKDYLRSVIDLNNILKNKKYRAGNNKTKNNQNKRKLRRTKVRRANK